MNFIPFNTEQKILEPSVITVGSFDGVHLGHQALFEEMNLYAKKHNCKTVVITFNPHPQEVLQNKPDFFLINSFDQILQLLEKYHIDVVSVIPFSKEFSQKKPELFIKEDILTKINVKAIFMGPNHHFGKHREGDANTLTRLCKENNIELVITPEHKIDGVEVRSTLIRKYLTQKDWHYAEKLMGHNIYNR